MQPNLQALQKVNAHLQKLRTNGLQKANLEAGAAVKGWIDQNFAQQGGLTPAGWPAPKNATFTANRLLQQTGRLRRNWHINADNLSVSVKAGASYALAHHTGAGDLPPRPLVPQGQTLANLVLPVYAKIITRQLP